MAISTDRCRALLAPPLARFLCPETPSRATDEDITAPVRTEPLPQQCSARLIALNGPRPGTDYRLRSGDNWVGSSRRLHIVLDDGFVSRRHFVLTGRNGRFVLTDLGSTNGTYVNGKRTARSTLANGDVVVAGAMKLRFLTTVAEGAEPQAIAER